LAAGKVLKKKRKTE